MNRVTCAVLLVLIAACSRHEDGGLDELPVPIIPPADEGQSYFLCVRPSAGSPSNKALMYMDFEYEGTISTASGAPDVVTFEFGLPAKDSLFIYGPRESDLSKDCFYINTSGGAGEFQLSFECLAGSMSITLKMKSAGSWIPLCTVNGQTGLDTEANTLDRLALPLTSARVLTLGGGETPRRTHVACGDAPSIDLQETPVSLVALEFDYFGETTGCTLAGGKLLLTPPWLHGGEEAEANVLKWLRETKLATLGCIVDPKPKPTQPGTPLMNTTVTDSHHVYLEYFSLGLTSPISAQDATLTFKLPDAYEVRVLPLEATPKSWINIANESKIRLFYNKGTRRIHGAVISGELVTPFAFYAPVVNTGAVFVPPESRLAMRGDSWNKVRIQMELFGSRIEFELAGAGLLAAPH
ncbi:MAG: hypothetical protein ABL998_09410 [Planctomycetota bacterium]